MGSYYPVPISMRGSSSNNKEILDSLKMLIEGFCKNQGAGVVKVCEDFHDIGIFCVLYDSNVGSDKKRDLIGKLTVFAAQYNLSIDNLPR